MIGGNKAGRHSQPRRGWGRDGYVAQVRRLHLRLSTVNPVGVITSPKPCGKQLVSPVRSPNPNGVDY